MASSLLVDRLISQCVPFTDKILLCPTGAALGGVILPLVLPPLISSYGPQKALRFLAITFTSLLVPALPFVKGRLPELRSRVTGPGPRGTARGWLRQKIFWLTIGINTLQGFGYFVPILWLPCKS